MKYIDEPDEISGEEYGRILLDRAGIDMKVIPGALIKRFHHVWSYRLVMATIFRWFSRLGITIVPYYLFIESNDLLKAADIKPILDKPYETIIMDPYNADLIKEFKTFPRNMRGRNIAPFLRNILAVHVQSMGRTRRYSITEQFNTPAMNF